MFQGIKVDESDVAERAAGDDLAEHGGQRLVEVVFGDQHLASRRGSSALDRIKVVLAEKRRLFDDDVFACG
jgi:hypothetical protein